jgi:hypothetical protein
MLYWHYSNQLLDFDPTADFVVGWCGAQQYPAPLGVSAKRDRLFDAIDRQSGRSWLLISR